MMTRDVLVTVRKTPPDGPPALAPAPAQDACRTEDNVAQMAYHLVDDIAESFLDLVDALNEEIDELEDHVEEWEHERVRTRLSSLRHDMLHIRRTLGPTRDAIREVVDNRIEFEGDEVFTHDVELNFGERLRQAAARGRQPRALARPRRRRARLPPGEDRERPERRDEAAGRDRDDRSSRSTFLTGVLRPELRSCLVNDIEIPSWTFWVLGVGARDRRRDRPLRA